MKRRWTLLLLPALVLSACAVVLDFDGYGTNVTAPRDAGPPLEADTDLELTVTDVLRVEPGKSALLTIDVKRGGGTPRPVVVTATEPLPLGIEPILATTIDANASRATLTITARLDGPTTPQTLRLTATSGAVTRRRDVALALRGAPCTPDRSFGPNGDGHVTTALGGASSRASLVVDGAGIVVGAPLGNGFSVIRLDDKGAPLWSRAVAENSTAVVAAPNHAVVVVTTDALRRILVDGTDDVRFNTESFIEVLCPTLVRANPNLAVVCDYHSGWALTAFDQDGYPLLTTEPSFGLSDVAAIAALSGATDDTLGCGTITQTSPIATTRGGLARWRANGTSDLSFAVSGRLLLGADTSIASCVEDAIGIVALGRAGDATALFALSNDGTIASTFGDAGVLPLTTRGTNDPPTLAVATDDKTVLALVGVKAGASIFRLLRDGHLDPAFGTGGECGLGPLGLGGTAAIVVAPEHKLVVLSREPEGIVVARLWL